jgi:hypothetical protein
MPVDVFEVPQPLTNAAHVMINTTMTAARVT